MRTTFLGMRVPDCPKAIRCKVGDLVYATWWDYRNDEPIGGLGIVVGVESKRIKILYNGLHQKVSPRRVYDPEEGKAYFEPPNF